MLGLVGVIAMDTSVAGVTVRVVSPDILPDVALMVAKPTPLPFTFTCPGLLIVAVVISEELLIVATPASDELQVTDAVRSFVVLSE
jgi:hypothetical protein